MIKLTKKQLLEGILSSKEEPKIGVGSGEGDYIIDILDGFVEKMKINNEFNYEDYKKYINDEYEFDDEESEKIFRVFLRKGLIVPKTFKILNFNLNNENNIGPAKILRDFLEKTGASNILNVNKYVNFVKTNYFNEEGEPLYNENDAYRFLILLLNDNKIAFNDFILVKTDSKPNNWAIGEIGVKEKGKRTFAM